MTVIFFGLRYFSHFCFLLHSYCNERIRYIFVLERKMSGSEDEFRCQADVLVSGVMDAVS